MDDLVRETTRRRELRRMWEARRDAVAAGVPEDRLNAWYEHVYGDVPPERLDAFHLVRVRMKFNEMADTQIRFDGRSRIVDQ